MRLIFLILLSTCFELSASVTATIDQKKIKFGQSIQLNISSDNASSRSPNLSSLKLNFKVIGSSKVSRPYIKNNQRKIKTLWFYILQPKRSGQLVIPTININGEKTKSITVQVSRPKRAKPRVSKSKPVKKKTTTHNIIVKASLNKAKLYPNEMLVYTLSINAPKDSVNHLKITPPFIAGAIVLPLNNIRVTESLIRGKPREIHTEGFAIFTEELGIYKIDPAEISVDTLHDDGSESTELLKANNLHFETMAKANQNSLGYWIPSDKIQLTQRWEIPEQLSKGDSIRRTVTLKAYGINADILPLISTLTHENIRMSLEDVSTENKIEEGKLVAIRSETVSMTFDATGSVSIEPIDIHWWNTALDQARVASLDARTFTVTAITSGEQAQPTNSQPATIQSKDREEDLQSRNKRQELLSANQLNGLIALLFIMLIITTAGWLANLRKNKRQS